MLAEHLYRLSRRAPVRFRLRDPRTEEAMRNFTDVHLVAHDVPSRGPGLLRALGHSPQAVRSLMGMQSLSQAPEALEDFMTQLRRVGLAHPDALAVYGALSHLLSGLQSIESGADPRLAQMYSGEQMRLHGPALHDALDTSGAARQLPGVLRQVAGHPEAIPEDVLGQILGAGQSALQGHLPSLLALYHGLLGQQQRLAPARPTVADMLGQGVGLASKAALHLKANLARGVHARDSHARVTPLPPGS